jgi:hypothetical protein
MRVNGAPQAPAGASATVIQAVDAAPVAGRTAVAIHARGPLPAPRVGILDAPARIYLDFAGVRVPTHVTAEWKASTLRGVRVAQRSIDPLVARVVIDLQAPEAHQVDGTKRGEGRVMVFIGDGGPVTVAGTRPASGDAERYLARVSPALERLHALRPVMASIDSPIVSSRTDLIAAAAELDALGRTLGALKVPGSLATTHDLLLRACALGARAARMLSESMTTGDENDRRNASSAAAGALIVLDRASRDLGYVPGR